MMSLGCFFSEFFSNTLCTSHSHHRWDALAAFLSEYVSATCCTLHFCRNMFPPLAVPHIPVVTGLLLFQLLPLCVPHTPHVTANSFFGICFCHSLYLTFPLSMGWFDCFSFRICFLHLLYLHSFRNMFPPLSVSHIPDVNGLLPFQNPFPPLTLPHIPDALGC